MSLDQRYTTSLDKCVESLKTWNKFIEENLKAEEKEAEKQKLQEITKEYMNIHQKYEKSKTAIKAVEEKLADNEQTHDIDALYNELLPSQPYDEEFAKEEIWRQVFTGRQSVMEVKQKLNKLSDAQYDLVSENYSLLCSNIFTPPIDPISKVVIKHPLTNKKCKHVYESQTINSYMKQRKHKAKCPYIGCSNEKIVLSDLAEDHALRDKITQYLESQPQDDSDSSDE